MGNFLVLQYIQALHWQSERRSFMMIWNMCKFCCNHTQIALSITVGHQLQWQITAESCI